MYGSASDNREGTRQFEEVTGILQIHSLQKWTVEKNL